ncbi:MAG: amino acid ABC transporter substrate-binding protein, partial [Candidatus Neomarinimicrobiota bacterium]
MFKQLTIVVAAIALLATSGHAAELYGTLKKIKQTGTVNLGHREASVPFAYMGKKGEPIGYTMDLCYKIIDRIKKQLHLPDLKIK